MKTTLIDTYQDYNVHKFGGTSLANSECFKNIKALLQGKKEIIVVSAVKDVTSHLQNLLDIAKEGKDFFELLNDLKEKHLQLAQTLLPSTSEIDKTLNSDFETISNLLHAIKITNFYSKEFQDLIIGYGELWSGKILSQYLKQFAKVLFIDASKVLYIVNKDGVPTINWKKSEESLQNILETEAYDQIVITGFIAATNEGRRTTLGRNGSDFSAAIFTRLFQANCLYIWTDVDGIYTADPQKVRSAFVLDSLSYNEALELAYFGAKVLHPMTIAPLIDRQIPLFVKNSFKPQEKGTFITSKSTPLNYSIKGLTCIDNVGLINIEGAGMLGVSGIAARVFQILHQAKVSVILISQASSEHSICFAVAFKDLENAIAALKEHLQFETDQKQIERINANPNCAILAAVGDGMVGAVGIASKLTNTLAKANINILAISQGSSERNISIVIDKSVVNKALQAVHSGFYLSSRTISIGLIGTGQVGKELLHQIASELHRLQSRYQVNLLVRGLMNSQKMLLSHEAIDLKNWKNTLEKQGLPTDLNLFADHILSEDMPHGVIIDCTANSKVSLNYLGFIKKGIHVVTPNKHAGAGDLNYYQQLKTLVRQTKTHFLYEATVCAGLPVITTLQDLVKTGDEIIKIEGVVSGTLSYIFNEMAKGKCFSECVFEAKKLGYTEPDPREDLSGMDVARKFVCLAREVGFSADLKGVNVTNLVPEALRHLTLEQFMEQLPLYDAELEKISQVASKQNQRLGYVGSIEADGKINVQIGSFPLDHSFSQLKGTDNMLIFHTRRYRERPLVIQGPGAGAEVTAAGIFADLLRLISFISE